MFTAATVVILGFFAVLAGVGFQRLRQSLQDRGELKARLERNARRVRREVILAALTVLVIWVAFEVVEHGGMH
jgi:hypothetical protein